MTAFSCHVFWGYVNLNEGKGNPKKGLRRHGTIKDAVNTSPVPKTNSAPAKLAALAVPVAPHLDGPRAVFDSSVWLRLPRPSSRCPVSGLSRSTLAELVRPCSRNDYSPPVESRLLKRKGASRGVLLINRQSLLDYINEQPAPTRADNVDFVHAVDEDGAKGSN